MFTGYLGGAKAAKYGMRDSIFHLCLQLTQMICCMHLAKNKQQIDLIKAEWQLPAACFCFERFPRLCSSIQKQNEFLCTVCAKYNEKKRLMEFFDKQSPTLTVPKPG